MPTCPNCKHTWGRESAKPKILFNYESGHFENLNGEVEFWQGQFPAIDVQAEIRKAEAWAFGNEKNRKSNWKRFLTNWMLRAQDKAPAQGGGHAQRESFAQQRDRERREQHERVRRGEI